MPPEPLGSAVDPLPQTNLLIQRLVEARQMTGNQCEKYYAGAGLSRSLLALSPALPLPPVPALLCPSLAKMFCCSPHLRTRNELRHARKKLRRGENAAGNLVCTLLTFFLILPRMIQIVPLQSAVALPLNVA